MSELGACLTRLAKASERVEAEASILVARQPIFDRDGRVSAFELLYRPAPGATNAVDGEQATFAVMMNSLTGIGLDQLVGDRPAHINVTRKLLLELDPLPVPPKRVVLELVESEVVDERLLRVLRKLADQGFRIALDNFVLAPERMPLLECASIVKLDVQSLERTELASHVALVSGRELTLLASKVETRQEYAELLAMGFDAFQGYYFAEPTLVTANDATAPRMELLSSLLRCRRNLAFEELEELIARDPELSNRFLRFANSAYYVALSSVGSIHDGLTRLGTTVVRRWLLVMALARLTDRPGHLLTLALQRARTCELLAEQLPLACPDICFTVGLLSVLDALVGCPIETILGELPPNEYLTRALLCAQGVEARLLNDVRAFERGALDGDSTSTVDPVLLSRAHQRAAHWADLTAVFVA